MCDDRRLARNCGLTNSTPNQHACPPEEIFIFNKKINTNNNGNKQDLSLIIDCDIPADVDINWRGLERGVSDISCSSSGSQNDLEQSCSVPSMESEVVVAPLSSSVCNTNSAAKSKMSSSEKRNSAARAVGIPPSFIHLMNAYDTDDEWEPVMQRIRTHPGEISLQSKHGGLNAIHAACVRYPPSRVIRAMLDFAPDAALQQNHNGETPLHLASYSSSEEVQEMLVRERPEAARIADRSGDLPLHFAARAGATPRLIEHFLYAYPEAMNQQNMRKATPFWLLPRSYLEAEDLLEIMEEDNEDYRDDWDLLILFLRYSAFGRGAWDMSQSQIEDYESWVVHAAAASPSCPVEVLNFLCRMFPSEDVIYNSAGFTPLLLACMTPDMEEPKVWNEIEDGFGEHVGISDSFLRVDEQLSEEAATAALRKGDADFILQALNNDEDQTNGNVEDFETAVNVVIEWSPRSIFHVGRQGRLPLAHALVAGKSFKSVKSLITACPRALECRDKPTGLYMFQLAAMHSPDLDTVFAMTRATPEFLFSASTTTKGIEEKKRRNNDIESDNMTMEHRPTKRSCI